MGSGEDQTYCLRWNNHKTNLVEILDGLFQKKDYVDCTLQVDDTAFPVHRVVLAANSSYFQNMLQNAPMDNNTYILFPGVRGREMRILLDYMYTGEVNVTQRDILRIIQIAEQLEIKGLTDMSEIKDKFDRNKVEELPGYNLNSIQASHINNNKLTNQTTKSSPIISQSANISSSVPNSTGSPPYSYKSNYSNMFAPSASDCPPPQWPIAAALTAQLPCGKLL